MPTFGTIKRQKPRLEVLRGYNPNEPHTFTQAVPVAADEEILSGQLITEVYSSGEDRYEWFLGVYDTDGNPLADSTAIAAAAAGGTLAKVFVALQDSTDEDVLSAGNLVGLSCAGQFELESAFFAANVAAAAQTYNVDTPLTPCGNDEVDSTVVPNISLKGFFKKGAYQDGNPLIGIVTRNRGLKDLGPQAGANGAILKHQVNSNVIDQEVVSFYTHWDAANTLA
jgi:hypothetical protein